MKVEFSDAEYEGIARIARGCGMTSEAWLHDVIARIADMRGMPVGVINPHFDRVTCPACGHEKIVVER
jgi:transposase